MDRRGFLHDTFQLLPVTARLLRIRHDGQQADWIYSNHPQEQRWHFAGRVTCCCHAVWYCRLSCRGAVLGYGCGSVTGHQSLKYLENFRTALCLCIRVFIYPNYPCSLNAEYATAIRMTR